ncbi:MULTISPECIES: shikimate kinase [unclassified Nitratiruptor]|uniref:shikimate kinase n=1 Tax=unclassified Nitratiruptor TaxID=2624044 RepID=UPI0019162480|nr:MULTISPECIES: shikimate kinase [unclassified Nitratiruptor]BCD59978.1 shikimate kinase [Nitratiruptor sp. YY08-10]BCD63901.1 shikimate kinase [Nitratiruptor sp. YY08-14]
MKNILLIGFMGVGKGTLARAMAGKTDIYAIDTDDLIESLTNTKIKKIFKKKGEKYFRKLEQKTADWLASSVKNSIISTGGGFYKVKNIKDIGIVVYLQADFDWIYERITKSKNAKKKIKKRPLFKSYEDAKKLYKQRVKEYEKVADIIVNVQNRSTEELIEEILTKVKDLPDIAL